MEQASRVDRQAGARVVRLGDYRRDAWTALDLAWEQVMLRAAAALAGQQQVAAAVLLTRGEGLTRLSMAADDPRRAATLTLLGRWELALGNEAAAERLRLEAEHAWCAALGWLERLRPGGQDGGQAECRELLRRAIAGSAASASPPAPPPGGPPLQLAGLRPDRRKLAAAVVVAAMTLPQDGLAARPRVAGRPQPRPR